MSKASRFVPKERLIEARKEIESLRRELESQMVRASVFASANEWMKGAFYGARGASVVPEPRPSCSSCRYWSSKNGAAYGQCRYHAPVATDLWPEMEPDEFCGQWSVS